MFGRLQILFLFTLLFSACVDSVDLPETSESSKIIIEAELAPPSHIVAKLSTTGDLNGVYKPQFPKDAVIRLYSSIDEEFVFEYNEDKSLYEVKKGRLRNGTTYTLNAYLRDNDKIETAIGSTSLPSRNKVERIYITDFQESNDNVSDTEKIEVAVTIEQPRSLPAYFHFTSKARLDKFILNGSDLKVERTGEYVDLEIVEIKTGGGAVQNINHMEGVLIDHSRIDDNTFTVVLAPKTSLPENTRLGTLQTNLRNTTVDYYKYHSSKSSQMGIGNNSIIEPVITYSNIENGLGLMGAFSPSIDTFSLVK